jgi:sarcosine oxidase subunit alpha
LTRYAVACGRTAVVFTNNDSGYRTARDLQARGVGVEAVIDSRTDAKADAGGALVLFGRMITGVVGGKGISGVTLSDGTRLKCDVVAMSGGYSPIVNLTCQRGATPRWSADIAGFVPPPTDGLFVAAGSAAGKMLLSECLADGAAVGAHDGKRPPVPRCRDEAFAISPLWWVKSSKGKAFVDYQNDATADDLLLAEREGYTNIEHVKRYTTTGMATDQGKLGNVNAIAIVAEAQGKTIEQVGTTTFRPFYTPVCFGVLAGPFAGRHFQPVRKSPLHEWAADFGATFVDAGLWLRSAWFPGAGETWLASADREVRNARERVGICDVSTLGKIDVQGRDAGVFLDRLYCNTFSALALGRARYGIMLREDGIVFDDGTTSRLAEDHFLMTTTTANAGRVMSHMEFCHQALWPDLDVTYVSVTEQWAQMAVAGPKARATMQKVVDGIALDDTTFPYLAAKEITVLGGIAARLFRISFSGEHAYELAVPADYGSMIAHAVMQAGEEFGIAPYGTEALSIMRIEKGHVAGGELNGTTTAADLGLGRMMSTKKDYIGRVMAAREGLTDKHRQCLVGLLAVNKSDRIRAGSHLLKKDDAPSMANDQGYLSSVAWSPMLDRWIGLALLANGRERRGEVLTVFDGLRNHHVRGEVCDPVHYDRENTKLHA